MKRRRTLIVILFLFLIIAFTPQLFSCDSSTDVIITNHTNANIENLAFSSNDNEEGYIISNIPPSAQIKFKYDIGGFNENAVVLKQTVEPGDKNSYSIIGYVTEVYSQIYINIVSINEEGELSIEVTTH